MSEFHLQTVIIDNGSGLIKAGLSEEDSPQAVFSSYVGKAKYPVVLNTGVHSDVYISNQDFAKSGILDITHPIENGIIVNWEAMEQIWHHTYFKALQIEPPEHPIFFIDSLNYTIEQRQKIAEINFEKFNVPSIFFQTTDILALLASGRTTGLVLDSGEGITSVSAIYEDYKIPQATVVNKVAGGTLTNYLLKHLSEDPNQSISLHTTAETIVSQEIKETLCYVAQDFNSELEKAKNGDELKSNYLYPDGQTLTINELRFIVPEFLFKPSIWGCELKGIHDIINDSILTTDVYARKDLYANICISGGNTMFNGFKERLQDEIIKLAPKSLKINVYSPEERKYAAWRGASHLNSHVQFPKMVITKGEYSETGPTIIDTKCP